jgi:hypothetical protein
MFPCLKHIVKKLNFIIIKWHNNKSNIYNIMILTHTNNSSFRQDSKKTIYCDRIIPLLKTNNSIFGTGNQITNAIIDVHSLRLDMNGSKDFADLTDSGDSTDLTDSGDSTDLTDSGDSTDLTDSGDSTSDKYVENYNIFLDKTKKYIYPKYIHKKIVVNKRECFNYDGGTVSEFNKDSPFINMLINKRIRACDRGPSCHIASFVQDLGMENKFMNWAWGKLAIGENSERMRFGNDRLSTHAEMDALKKLDGLIRVQKCKRQKMDLVVIRVNKTGNLCESAPCYHCTKELERTKVVSINKLYFSRSDGTITCVKFSVWLKNKNLHISKGWRWMNCESK